MRATHLIIALATAAPLASATPQVYENFNYPVGDNFIPSLDWGTGWNGGFSGTLGNPLGTFAPIVAGSFTHPASPAPSGNAFGGHTQAGATYALTRNIAQPFTTDQTIWMSCVFKASNLPSGGSLHLGEPGASGAYQTIPGFYFSKGGYGLDPGAGQPSSVSWPDTPVRPFLYFLIRFGPAIGNQRPMDLWLNPAPGVLGAPNNSIMGDAVLAGRFTMALGGFTGIDEIRIDTNLANVYVPAPSVAATLALAGTALRRRHRAA